MFAFTAVTTGVTTLLLRRVGPLPPACDEAPGETPGGTPGKGAEDDGGSLLVAFRYAARNRVVGGLLALGGVTALFNLPVVLFPEFVDTRFGGGEVMLGLLYTAPAVGAVLVSATSGWGTRSARPGRLLLAAACVGGLATIGFGLSGQVTVAVVMLSVGGAAGTVHETLEYALLQHHTPDRLRGRVVGVITTQGTTGDVVGDAEVAVVARWFSPAGAAVVNGVVCAAAVLVACACLGCAGRGRPGWRFRLRWRLRGRGGPRGRWCRLGLAGAGAGAGAGPGPESGPESESGLVRGRSWSWSGAGSA